MVAYSTLINMAPYSTPIKMYVSVLLFSLGPSTGLQTIVIVSMALYSTLKKMAPYSTHVAFLNHTCKQGAPENS